MPQNDMVINFEMADRDISANDIEKGKEFTTDSHLNASINPAFIGDVENSEKLEKELTRGKDFQDRDSIDTDDNATSKVRIEWTNLHVDAVLPPLSVFEKLKLCCKKKKEGETAREEKTKPILKGVNGVVEPGNMLALMGASGAGKTTLLNVLSRQERSRLKIRGSVLINNKNIRGKIKSLSAYVKQETLFIGTLTVKEHLYFQARLRMDENYSNEEKKKRVADVIRQLSLIKCQNTMIGIPGRLRGISGGELKRLSFASELILNPPLLFVDEPTSGLDSFMAESSIMALQELAKQGKTIITTIHQPSSEVFYLFDRLLLMAEGRNAFLGTKEEAVQFFNRVGYPCPMNYNPADHYIRTLAVSPENAAECRERCNLICDKYEETTLRRKESTMGEIENDSEEIAVLKYKQNVAIQTAAVCSRAFKSFYREPFYMRVKTLQNLFVAIIAGLIYLQQKDGQAGVRNINGAIFFLIINLTFNYVISATSVFAAEVPIFLKENSQRMYRIDAYFLGRTFSELPFVVFTSSITMIIVYWMTGFYDGAKQFFIFYGILQLVVQTAISYGYVISALSPSVLVATAISSPMILPLLLFGGFFIQDRSIPVYFVWLKVFSWFKYANEALQINQWESFGPISCKNGTEACIPNGLAVLHLNGYDPAHFNTCIGALVALLVGFRILAFLFILLKTYRNK